MEVIKDQKQKKFCESENDGLKDLEVFLKQFKNCILLAIDDETIQVILDKFRKAKIGMEIKGFFTWPTILKKLVPNKVGTELEDFYSEFCNEEINLFHCIGRFFILKESILEMYRNEYPLIEHCQNYKGPCQCFQI